MYCLFIQGQCKRIVAKRWCSLSRKLWENRDPPSLLTDCFSFGSRPAPRPLSALIDITLLLFLKYSQGTSRGNQRDRPFLRFSLVLDSWKYGSPRISWVLAIYGMGSWRMRYYGSLAVIEANIRPFSSLSSQHFRLPEACGGMFEYISRSWP